MNRTIYLTKKNIPSIVIKNSAEITKYMTEDRNETKIMINLTRFIFNQKTEVQQVLKEKIWNLQKEECKEWKRK